MNRSHSSKLTPVTTRDISEAVQRAQEAADAELIRERSGPSNDQTDIDILANRAADIFRQSSCQVTDLIRAARNHVSQNHPKSLIGILPLLLRLKGKPYTLDDYFPFEPLFSVDTPPAFVLKCARQVSKSASLASRNVIRHSVLKHFNSLFINPLSNQTLRFSKQYVRPFITDSVVGRSLLDRGSEQSILQITFRTRSTMYFSYCLSDADRVRGIAADSVIFDEAQDIDWDLIPVVMSTTDGSKWATMQVAGTPKTMDNTMERMWSRSSQAEWVVRCDACNYYNIPCLSQDVLDMIGERTVVCAKCSRPINPRPVNHPVPRLRGSGFWLHAHPNLAEEFPGYHVPQIIMPSHYENLRKWQTLRRSMDPMNTPRHIFINEKIGEAADSGTMLISQPDLQKACGLYGRPNRLSEAVRVRGNYMDVAVGVDWGGSTAPFGAGRAYLLSHPDETYSFTALAILGIKTTGRIDVLYVFRFDTLGDHVQEAYACLRAWNDIDKGRAASVFCHDFGGAGSVRETILIQSGLPVHCAMGMQYTMAPHAHIIEPKESGGRVYWQVDKARSLLFLCESVRSGFVGMPSWETSHDRLSDFLSLMEDVIERPGGSDIMRILRKPGMSDDVAHAINFAAHGLWHRHGYPNFSDIVNIEHIMRRLSRSADGVDQLKDLTNSGFDDEDDDEEDDQ